jgi:hypothetical protein
VHQSNETQKKRVLHLHTFTECDGALTKARETLRTEFARYRDAAIKTGLASVESWKAHTQHIVEEITAKMRERPTVPITEENLHEVRIVLQPSTATTLEFKVVPPHYFKEDLIDHQDWQVLLQESMNRHPQLLVMAGQSFWVIGRVQDLVNS